MFNFISILDLYGYGIFDDIKIPVGIDKDLLINSIMDKCATNEPLYTDENLLKAKIEVFFQKNYQTYERLFNAYTLEYNPIENYDRKESLSKKVYIENEVANNDSYNEDRTSKVSPYDVDSFKNDSNDVLNSSTDKKENGKRNENVIEENRIHGNIGVTTTQQMLASELDIVYKLNIYELIANDFYNEFMLKCM